MAEALISEDVVNLDGKATLWINPKWKMDLLTNHHAKFCLKLLHSLPVDHEELETQRITILQFCVTSLDLLNQMDVMKDDMRKRIVEWVYRLQIKEGSAEHGGFQGSPVLLFKDSNDGAVSSHIAMTYAALVTLLTLGDDLSRVDKDRILYCVSKLQNRDGSFQAGYGCSENDMRFAYCAVCTCYILNDFTRINIEALVGFIKRSFTYEGSFSSGHASEGHAGHTYCAVASLFMLSKLHDTLNVVELNRLKKWCIDRQGENGGFTGRPNKAEDTCYSYWIGGTLALLDSLPLVDSQKNVDFVLGNQNPLSGGIGKSGSDHVDPLHTFLGLAGLSLLKYKGLNCINPILTMSTNATKHLLTLHSKWENSA